MRIAVSALVGASAAVVAILFDAALISPAIGWDVGALTFLVWTWLTIGPMSAEDTAAHATREDPSRPVSDVVLIASAVVSLGAVGIVLVQASSEQGSAQDLLAGVGVATVALSWLLVHTVYTVQYARLYYTDEPGGIDFNQGDPPRYSDFAYLSLTLGMTFQVSDTDLQEPRIRATVLRQALLSYLFGVVIVATTINLIASLGSRRGI
ncbi:MAG: hypothetical protein QOD68_796 [Actinomycetota bacterium]|jgi:uncharacterized membrane protein|nr:hypothetical protein [Actinomycetota bacterium]